MLKAEYDGRGDLMVDWAMRYGQPSIPNKLEVLRKAGFNRFVILPYILNMPPQPQQQ